MQTIKGFGQVEILINIQYLVATLFIENMTLMWVYTGHVKENGHMNDKHVLSLEFRSRLLNERTIKKHNVILTAKRNCLTIVDLVR